MVPVVVAPRAHAKIERRWSAGSVNIQQRRRVSERKLHVRSNCWQHSRTLASALADVNADGLLLPDVGYHIYYMHRAERVEVVAVWPAGRGRTPR